MQSGISASQDLKRAFASFLEAPSQRALLAHIASNPDQISPGKTIPSSTTPLAKDLDNVAAALGDNEAAYVLLQDDKGKAVAVTYVPLTAPVRSKMLYSSSSLTLARDLGGPDRISSARTVSSRAELTAAGWAAQEAHDALPAPLTEEERSNVGLRDAEAAESMGTGTRRGGHVVQGGVTMAIDHGAVTALEGLLRDGGAVQLTIAQPAETISLVSKHSASEATPATLAGLISPTKPRYTFYKHAPNGCVLFIYTCPAGCSVRERMTHATSMRSLPSTAEKQAGVKVEAQIEASSADDLTERDILEKVDPSAAEESAAGRPSAAGVPGGGFARPKRPGRR